MFTIIMCGLTSRLILMFLFAVTFIACQVGIAHETAHDVYLTAEYNIS